MLSTGGLVANGYGEADLGFGIVEADSYGVAGGGGGVEEVFGGQEFAGLPAAGGGGPRAGDRRPGAAASGWAVLLGDRLAVRRVEVDEDVVRRQEGLEHFPVEAHQRAAVARRLQVVAQQPCVRAKLRRLGKGVAGFGRVKLAARWMTAMVASSTGGVFSPVCGS